MRLGDFDALMELYDMGSELEEYAEVLSVPVTVIRQNIKDMPTIDAVPVVRCKDCKWFAECVGKDSGKPCGYGQCTRPLCMRSLIGTDDFCSYGERKEADGNG